MNKRLTALLLVLCMILSIMPTVFATGEQKFTDFPTGWSKEAMTAAVNNGLLVGVSDTEIKPQDNLTRAELAAIVVRAFGASTIADISAYKDVPPSEWYANYIAKAVKMEALNGRSATEMAPEANITREEVFVALARILVLESSDPSSLLKFKDAGSISAWAIPAMSALAAKGYINGDETGNVNPKAYITREEFAQFMHNMIKTYITKPGTYTDDDFAGITVIRTGDVTLKNVKNINDLVVGDGAGTGAIYLENVTIVGRLLARGGHFTLKDTKISENVVVKNVNNVVKFNNYRDELAFLGINEITDAEFLEKSKPVSGGSSNNRPTVQTADYTVKHIREKINPEDPDLIETETLNGEVGKNTSAVAKSYTGFTAGEVTQQLINENGSTVVEINYSRNTYTMTFALGNGQPDVVLNLKYEAPLSIGNPTWPGHVFAGWSPSLPTKVPAENKTYTAVWDAATANYTVKHIFEKLNDSDPDIIKTEVKTGVVGAETAAEYLSDEAARELLGTLKYEGFEKGIITQVEIAESGTEVVINYTRKTYNATFVLDNGEANIVRPFKHGAMVVFTDTISKQGYTFNGWSPALGIINASDATYTAQWTANNNTGYTVEYYLEKLEGGYALDSTDDTKTGTTDTMTNVVAPAKEGFTAQTIEQKNINGDGSTVVKVYYTRNSYVITFVLGNGEADVVTTLKFGATLTAPTPTWYGHVFTGWTPSVPSTVPAENKTYTAVWDWKTANYTVKHIFEKLNDSDPDIIKIETKSGVVGAETAAEYLSDEAAQDFLGTVDYKGFKAPSSVTQVTIEESGTVVEIYYTRNEYKFVFVKGNGEANEEIMVKYQAPVNAPAPTWEGRTFNGWIPANAETPVLPEFAPVFPEGVTKFVYNATWTVKVTFFYYYTDSPSAIIDTKTIAYKASVDAEYMDTLPEYSEDGYVKENQYAPTLYNGEKHKVYTDYLYKNDDGEWKNFDENVVVTKDTNVYCMFRKFGIYMSHPSLASFMVGATYAHDETRILDSVKDLLYSGKSQLSILTDLPEYQRVRDKLTDKLERTKVLNSDGEIKVIELPVPIYSVITPEKMRGQIREYIGGLLKTEEGLDQLFSMIDVNDLINQIGIENILTNEQILSFLKDESNEDMVVGFVKDAIDDPTINGKIVDYLKDQIEINTELQNWVIDALRDKIETDADLKAWVVDALKEKLDTDTDLQDLVVDAIRDKLETDDELKALVVDAVKNKLEADDDLQDVVIKAVRNELDTNVELQDLVVKTIKNKIETETELQDLVIKEIKRRLETDEELQNVVVKAVRNKLESNTNLQDLVIAAIREKLETDEGLQDLVIAAIREKLETNTELQDLVVDTIKGKVSSDAELRETVIKAIKSKIDTDDDLRTLVSNAFKDKLTTDDELRAWVIGRLKEELTSDDELRAWAIGEIQAKLSSTEDASFRDSIIDNQDILESLIEKDAFKNKIVDLATGDEFIKIALDNDELKESLTEQLADNENFIKLLVDTTQFEDYLIDAIKTGTLRTSVKDLVKNNDIFRTAALDSLKANSTFMDLIGGDMRDDVLLKIEEYAPVEDVWDYAFGKYTGDKDFSRFIDANFIDNKINGYIDDEVSNPGLLTDEDIEDIRECLYSGSVYTHATYTEIVIDFATKKNDAMAEMRDEIDNYADDVLTEFTTNNGTVTNSELQTVIDDALVDMIIDYIDGNISNETAEEEIGSFIVEYVRDIVENDSADPDISEMVDKAKTEFADTAHTLDSDVLLNTIKDFRDGSDENKAGIKDAIQSQYNLISSNIITNIDTNPSIRAEIDDMLRTVDATLVKDVLDILLADSTDTLVSDIIDTYLLGTGGTNADLDAMIEEKIIIFVKNEGNDAEIDAKIESQILSFINEEMDTEIIAEVRKQMLNFIKNDNNDVTVEAEVRSQLLSFISNTENDPEIEAQVKEQILTFIRNSDGDTAIEAEVKKQIVNFIKNEDGNSEVESEVRSQILSIIKNEEDDAASESSIKEQILKFIKNENNDAEIERQVKSQLLTFIKNEDNDPDIDAQIEKQILSFVKNEDGDLEIESQVKSQILAFIKNVDGNPDIDEQIENQILIFIRNEDGDPDIESMIKDQILTFIKNEDDDPEIDAEITAQISNFIKNEDNAPDVEEQIETQIKNFIKSDAVDIDFVAEYRDDLLAKLDSETIDEIVDEDMIRDYIGNMSGSELEDLVNEAFEIVNSNEIFSNFMSSFENKEDTFEINQENIWLAVGVANAVKSYTYEQIIELVDNKLADKIIEYLGDDFLKGFFEEAQLDYYDGIMEISDKIEQDKAEGITNSYEYTTALTFVVNIIDDVLRPLYDKATTKAINVLDNRGINYHSNEYLEYLINQDYIYELIEETGLGEVNELTGYKIKNEKEYYDLIVKYVMLVDDAICWYGDNLTEEQIDAILEAVLTKIFSAHDKFNEILTTYKETGELPERVENLIDSVEQLNSLMTQYQPQLKSIVTKYLNSSFNQHFEPSDVLDKDKVQTGIDVILGTDDPTFTLDILYEVFYRYDDKMQAKLKQLVDSGKLERAIDKFESTSFAELLRGRGGDRVTSIAEKIDEIKNSGKVTSAFDKMYDVFVLIAEHGIEPFRVEEDIETTVDAYEITYGGASFKVKRYVE